MTQRLSVDDLTDEQLDALHDQLDATYRERAHLVAHLAALHPSHIGHTDPAAPDWAVVTIETPAGQMTWHIAERDMDLFTHVQPTNRICRGWDGHTTDEKYARMRDLTESAPSLLSLEVVADQQAEHIKQLTAQLTKSEQGRRNLRGLLEHHRDQGSLGILHATRTRLSRALKACARYRAEITAQAARITTLEHVAAGNRKHVAAIVPELESAQAALAGARALHQPTEGLGFGCDEDETPGSYGDIAQVCTSCGTASEYGVRWPCPTIRALNEQPTTAQPSGCPHCGATTTHLPRRYMKNGRIGYCHGELTTDEQPT
ncbi:hypothetical protein AB0D98_10915 [Streptomyces sp. NPDC047987]|uniref:WDGH domain-containing protein n=1 Tax=unclassified Streptomyces TaxID=2593676 RepID=UPI003419E030